MSALGSTKDSFYHHKNQPGPLVTEISMRTPFKRKSVALNERSGDNM